MFVAMDLEGRGKQAILDFRNGLIDQDKLAEVLIRLLQAPITLHLAARLGITDHYNLDDAFQLFMIKLVLKGGLSSYNLERPLMPWLCKVARNVAKGYNRWLRLSRQVQLDKIIEPSDDAEFAAGVEELSRLNFALSKLSIEDQHIFELRLAGLTHEQIAKAAGRSVRTVKQRINKGLETMAKQAEPECTDVQIPEGYAGARK